jgi:ubiquinone/menaquinone biosynthesis C-methylase UbiE
LEEVYRRSQAAVMKDIERHVCGCDYGGCSWTTREEAENIVDLLNLGPGRRLLDLGAGSGWPGLYCAKISGCDLTLVDLPFAGLRIAEDRAAHDGLPGNFWAAAADATELPFADGAFDALSHSDLLCCLRQKRAVLAACRRAIRFSGRMVFTVISVTPGLAAAERRRAVEMGPEFVETETSYQTLLDDTGWVLRYHQDLTAAYVASLQRQLQADELQREGLEDLLGPALLSDRLADWHGKLAALEDGLLRRELFFAEPL